MVQDNDQGAVFMNPMMSAQESPFAAGSSGNTRARRRLGSATSGGSGTPMSSGGGFMTPSSVGSAPTPRSLVGSTPRSAGTGMVSRNGAGSGFGWSSSPGVASEKSSSKSAASKGAGFFSSLIGGSSRSSTPSAKLAATNEKASIQRKSSDDGSRMSKAFSAGGMSYLSSDSDDDEEQEQGMQSGIPRGSIISPGGGMEDEMLEDALLDTFDIQEKDDADDYTYGLDAMGGGYDLSNTYSTVPGRLKTPAPESSKPIKPLDFMAMNSPSNVPMPMLSPVNKWGVSQRPQLKSRDRRRWGGGAEDDMAPAVVFNTMWWILYLLNVTAVGTAVIWRPWEDSVWLPHYAVLGTLGILVLLTNILITDIATDFFCIFVAACTPSTQDRHAQIGNEPMSPERSNKYLVVYCLKSSDRTDVVDTLSYLEASWRVNWNYPATYCILSGTQDEGLVQIEMEAIKKWNLAMKGENGHVYYVRRTRSILFKYGQYLDLIMLINGHKEPMLYRDQKSNDGSGLCFDPRSDVNFFHKSDFEFIVLMDRDNMLSSNFFHTANRFFEANPDIQILQPAITPYPKEFRRGNQGESIYLSLSCKFQAMGNDLQKYKRVFIPSATFYGKGIIRRSTYNETLLGYDSESGNTQEEQNIPRDLLSHDIIESSVMRTMLVPEIAVYEDFPDSHVEWHLRQNRWDLGDLIISKYLYPFSFGLYANLLSCFSYAWVTSFYKKYFKANRSAIYSSTYNVRCILLKPLVLTLMVVYYLISLDLVGIYGLTAFLNIEMVLIPLILNMIVIRSLSWKEILLLQVHTIYMGIVDIYFGTFRMLRASSKIAMRTNKWRTFKPLGHSPVMTMITFIMNVQLELGVAIAGACTLVFFNWGSLSSRDYGMLGFLGLIITFPLYTLLTAVHKGSKSALLDSKLAKEKLVDDDGTLAAMSRILWADKQVEKGGYDSAAVDQKSTASSPLDLNMASPLSPASAQRQANDNLWSSISRVAG